MKKTYIALILIFVSIIGCSCSDSKPAPTVPDDKPKEKDYFYITGSRTDVTTNSRGGFLLAGGGTDNDDAMKWFLNNAAGGDIVIIRHSGSNGYNNYLYNDLGITVNSVTSIVIDDKTKANDEDVYNAICNAEALFIAGGDQGKYINTWGGTKVKEAIAFLVKKGDVTIGGTSAGMAILSEYCYTGANGSATSDVLMNPFHSTVGPSTLTKSIVEIPLFEKTVTDTHFTQRNRMGRLVVFIARLLESYNDPIYAVAADERSAIGIDSNGEALVFGPKVSLFKSMGNKPETCLPNQPLVWNCSKKALMLREISGTPNGKNIGNYSDLWLKSSESEWKYLYVTNGVLHIDQ